MLPRGPASRSSQHPPGHGLAGPQGHPPSNFLRNCQTVSVLSMQAVPSFEFALSFLEEVGHPALCLLGLLHALLNLSPVTQDFKFLSRPPATWPLAE